MQNRPRGRKVFTGGGGGNVFRPGSSSGGHSGGHSGGSYSGGSHSGGYSGGGYSGGGRGTGGRGGLLPIIIIAAVLLFGGGGLGASNLLGGGDDYQNSLYYGGSTYDGWYDGSSNTGSLNTDVSSQAREKFTAIKGGGRDISTVMVYMCGTDLESNSAMATKDLNEMLQASVGSNLNLIVYTGGCKSWRNNTISSDVNQIWQIQNGKLKCLERNAGNLCMTEPSTLSSFIRWTAKRYPANRMDLIFWDHGSGSISGYGYDQKYPRRGSMSLGGIDEALKNSGVKFDFVGFDACLMATSETALTVGKYADYMIGSEEVEPGIGWYYTNWLSQLSDNPSISTLETGRTIADDFVSKCASQCKGQPTTLSVVDLAELTQTLPETLNAFASDSSEMISGGKYKEVATARSGSKEFAGSSRLDQIDLTHFAMLMDTSAGNKLAKTLKSAVKYNRTSNNTANAYGLSIYFPLRTLNKVDSVTDTYSDIGMDDDYSACIRKFAQMEVSGQAVSGGNTISPFDILLGGSGSGSGSGSQQSMGTQAMQQLIGQLLSGNFSGFGRLGLDGLNSSNTEFLSSDPIDAAAAAEYVSENSITSSDLKWQENRDGQKVISLTEDQWSVVKTVDLQMFYDDGEGYIDLGLDNIYDFDEDGNLLPYTDKKWLSINGQVVAYYHTETIEKGDDRYVITGYVPIKLNGEDARLILSFDNNNEEGYIAGVSYDYDEDITETEAKNLPGLKSGDSVKFMCSFYSYDGTLQDSYQLGNTYNVDDPDDVVIRNVDVGSRNVKTLYKFTDIYDQEYWTPEIK